MGKYFKFLIYDDGGLNEEDVLDLYFYQFAYGDVIR